jgi:hypothetical protein
MNLSYENTSRVLGTLRQNQFSSSMVVAKLSGLSEREVEEVIPYLVQEKFIYQSVKGYPRRYSVRDTMGGLGNVTYNKKRKARYDAYKNEEILLNKEDLIEEYIEEENM